MNATILLMQLISEYKYYRDKGTLTEGNFFYSTVEHLQEETTLSKHEQLTAIRLLTALNILTVELKGIPAKRHFKVNFKGIALLFDRVEKPAKPPKSKTAKNPPTRKSRKRQLLAQNLATNNKR